MNISLNTNGIRNGLQSNGRKKRVEELNYPKNDVSFTGKRIRIDNASEIIKNIEDVLGKDYFTDLLKKSGIEYHKNAKFFEFDNPTIAGDLKRTFIALVNIPVKGVLKACNKLGVDENAKAITMMKKIPKSVKQGEDFDKVMDIIEAIAGGKNKVSKLAKDADEKPDILKLSKSFVGNVTPNIANVKKPFLSRDERTLNRLATSTVSAIFAANDYHNIAMLRKNNKKDANTSAKDRFQQDMIRAGIASTLTFFTLGALDRYTKSNIWLNAGVIALSSLVSEIATRLIKRKSMVPLTPEKAKEISDKRKGANQNNIVMEQAKAKTQNAIANPTYKIDLNKDKEIFKNFANKNGEFSTINEQKLQNVRDFIKADAQANENENKKNKNKLLKTVVGIAIASNIIYLINSFRKGKFGDSIDKIRYYNARKKGNYLGLESLAKSMKRKNNFNNKIKDIIKPVENYKSKFEKKDIVSPMELKSKLTALKATESGKKIKKVYEAYEQMLSKQDKNIEIKKDTILLKGVKDGVMKVFNMLRQICTLPVALLEAGTVKTAKRMEKILPKGIDNFDKWAIEKELIEPPKAKCKELEELSKLCFDKGHSVIEDKFVEMLQNNKDKKIFAPVRNAINKYLDGRNLSDEKIAQEIYDRIRDVAIKQETSQLANYSRTLVTLISSFFFVNDYYNESLINSEGKDIEGAKVKRNEKIGHKVINYISNGLFMNIFNSVFNKTLNGSLLGATLVAAATEVTNETTIRSFTCEPKLPLNSKEEIVKYEQNKLNRKGIMGAWSRFFRKITGKKTLTEKTANKVQK